MENQVVALIALATVLAKTVYDLVKSHTSKPPHHTATSVTDYSRELAALSNRVDKIEAALNRINDPDGWLRKRLHDLASAITTAQLTADSRVDKR